MRLYAYVIPYDNGFSPNPDHGYCTLACCKPRIRESVGKYVIESLESSLKSELDNQLDNPLESWKKDDVDEFFKKETRLSKCIKRRLIEKEAWVETAGAYEKIKAGREGIGPRAIEGKIREVADKVGCKLDDWPMRTKNDINEFFMKAPNRETIKKELVKQKEWDTSFSAWESMGANGIKDKIRIAYFEEMGYAPAGTLKGVKNYYKQPESFETFEKFVCDLEIFVVGIKPKKTNPKTKGSHIVYAMKVTDVLTFEEYWHDIRFKKKKPNPEYFKENEKNDGTFCPDDCGDNVYEIKRDENSSSDPSIVIHPSFHYFKNSDPIPQACTDLGGLYVLVSSKGKFSYFGKKAYRGEDEKEKAVIEGEPLHKGRGHSIYDDDDKNTEKGQKKLTQTIKDKVKDLIDNKSGIHAEPNGCKGSEGCIGEKWWHQGR